MMFPCLRSAVGKKPQGRRLNPVTLRSIKYKGYTGYNVMRCLTFTRAAGHITATARKRTDFDWCRCSGTADMLTDLPQTIINSSSNNNNDDDTNSFRLVTAHDNEPLYASKKT